MLLVFSGMREKQILRFAQDDTVKAGAIGAQYSSAAACPR
jgi:hypothetical protein